MTHPIRCKRLNFNSFFSCIAIDQFISDSDSLPCHCKGLYFIDEDHGFILTSVLRIIKRIKLKKLTGIVFKYGESKIANFTSEKNNIIEGISNVQNRGVTKEVYFRHYYSYGCVSFFECINQKKQSYNVVTFVMVKIKLLCKVNQPRIH